VERKAERQIWRCARVGGLNEESRIWRVLRGEEGDGGEGMEWRMRKGEELDVKLLREDA